MRLSRMASFAAACLLPALSLAQEPGLLFHVPFDGAAQAATAAGAAAPLQQEGLRFVEGVSGQAVAISDDTTLEYPAGANIVKDHGTVMMWFRPNWTSRSLNDQDNNTWHCLFQERLPEGVERIGSGQLWLWFWGASLRGDIADPADLYKTAGVPNLDPTTWAHVALTWDTRKGSQLYFNGEPVGSTSDGFSPLKLTDSAGFAVVAKRFESFFVGSSNGWMRADGAIDDLRIYDRALTPSQIAAEMATLSPLRVDCLTPFVSESNDKTVIRWKIRNVGREPRSTAHRWELAGADAQGQSEGALLAPGEAREITASLGPLPKGRYKLVIHPETGPAQSASIWVLGRDNPYLKASGDLTTQPVETIDFSQPLPAGRVVVHGESRMGQLAGQPYYEAGPRKNDRFAIRVTLPDANAAYLVEWDYPDDKLRTMEMVAQDAMRPGSDYSLQTGVFCGDEYPNSMRMQTHRSILWARSTDTAFIFMTARENAPAAISQLRISRIVGGLPDGDVRPARPVDGWTRTVGIHFEDPSIGFDFGVTGQFMPDYERTLDRLVAYMEYSGQNLLSYPAVWYHGRIGSAYQPRHHEEDFIGAILTKFAPAGLSFMPAINLQNIPLPDGVTITPAAMDDGSLHDSPIMILASGKPNPGGWHGTPPNFNPLHPAVQQYVDAQVDDLLARYGDSPAFKGITLHLTKHTITWFGAIEAGYNDYCIDAFTRDTGIKVPVDRAAPLRGKLYHDWLMANARDQWINWRCHQVAKWYKAIASRLAARRADLKLALFSYNPTVTDFGDDPRYGTPGFPLIVNRESGLDSALYADVPNIIMAQTTYPADYRWKDDRSAKARETLMAEHRRADAYDLLRPAAFPWVNMHDRYFEDGIGGANWWGKTEPLKAEWLKETPWRVSTLNPGVDHFLEHYVLPLRYGDVLGFTKGGFLIGTAGVEKPLLAFSRAFCALPAQRFDDLDGSTPTVRARVLRTPSASWFYIVNTDRTPVRAQFRLGADAAILDAVTGAPADVSVDLAGYELRSFRTNGPAPVGVTISVP